ATFDAISQFTQGLNCLHHSFFRQAGLHFYRDRQSYAMCISVVVSVQVVGGHLLSPLLPITTNLNLTMGSYRTRQYHYRFGQSLDLETDRTFSRWDGYC